MAQKKVTDIKEVDKTKQLDSALGQIERQFGSGTVMRMGEKRNEKIPAIPTGSLGLDIALGIGGLPRGRIVEIYGPESSGKTTLTLEVIAQCQKLGGTAAFIDAEHALDPIYAEKLGVNVDELLVSQPDTGEQALEVADIMVSSGGIDILVIDSVAALVPKAEIEGEMGDHHVGLQARLMSQALRKITGNVQKSDTLVIFINQIRHKIGVMFGSPETTAGGNALKFYSSVRMDIRRIGTVKDGDDAPHNCQICPHFTAAATSVKSSNDNGPGDLGYIPDPNAYKVPVLRPPTVNGSKVIAKSDEFPVDEIVINAQVLTLVDGDGS